MIRLLLVVSFSILSLLSYAANITWTNGNGTGIWNDAGNWSAGIPGPADYAIFNTTSTDDCLIDISINVRGIILQTGYTGTVTQSSGNGITVRDQDIFLADGLFIGSDAPIDMINGNFQIRGGRFVSTSDTLFLDVNFVVSDSGQFYHNNGTIVFDDGSNRAVNVKSRDTLFNLVFSPTANNAALNIDGLDTITILNKVLLNEGRVRGGPVEVLDSLEINPAYDAGENQVWIKGSGPSVLSINGGAASHPFFVDKMASNDSVFVQNDLGTTVSWGDPGDLLQIGNGVLMLNETSDLDFAELEILSGGTLIASSDQTNFRGNWDNQGGNFVANNGTWVFDAVTNNRSYSTFLVDSFFNLEMASANNVRINIDATDSIFIQNKLELRNGRFMTGQLLVEDTAILYSTYDDGNADLYFVGSTISNFLIESAEGDFDVLIRKDNSADTVYFQPLAGNSFNLGETNRNLIIQEGVLSLVLAESVDLDFANLQIQSGASLQASSGQTSYQGNWSNQGGSFNANNGSWIFDLVTNNRSYTTNVVDSFFNLEIAGDDNDRMNIDAADSIYIENKLELRNGRFMTGQLLVEDTAILYSTYDDGDADVYFIGSTTSNFLIESAEGNFDKFIRKDNPTDTVFFQPLSGNSLNIGETNRDLEILEGVLSFALADTVDLDYSSIEILSGAELQATSGLTTFQGSWNNINGKFNANQGTWIWDNNGNRGFATTEVDSFYTFLYQPTANNRALVMSPNDSIYIENRLDLNEGRILSGNLLVNDSAFLYATYDDGSASVYFIGSTTSNFFIEAAVGNFDKFIRKDNSTDTVFFQPFSGTSLTIGETDRDLFIEIGTLSFDLVDEADLNFAELIIGVNGGLQATSGTTRFQGDWDNQGGLFNANQGNWIWDNTGGNRTYQSTAVDTFFNFNYDPLLNRVLSMSADDSIYVENKLELSDGRVNTGHFLVHDTAYLYTQYDDGTADLWFIGTKTSNFIIESAEGNFNKFIRKDNPTDTVFYEPLSGNNLNIGETNRDLTIQEGILSFDLVDTVNLDYGNLNIEPGAQLQGSPGIITYQGNWNNQGGLFNANQGSWVWNNTGNRSYSSTEVDTFFNFNYNATNNRQLTMAADDSIYIENKLELTNGRIQTGHLLVHDTAYLFATYDDATADLWFVGTKTSNFIIEAAQGNFNKFIRKDTPTDTVFYEPLTGNSLTIGETDRDLTIQEGILSFGLVQTANLDYGDIFIEAGAKLQASPGITRYQGNFNNIAGGFNANNGTWIYDLGNDRTYTSHQVDTFFRMIFQPPSGNSDLFMTVGDAFAVEQALFLEEAAIFNGSIYILDSLEINTGYDLNGTADLIFSGNNDGTFLSNALRGSHDVIIDKANPAVKVEILDENGNEMSVGNPIRDFTIEEGRVEFPSNNPITFSFLNLEINSGGVFQAPTDTINLLCNWDNNNGKFEANGGTLIFRNSGNRTYNSTEVDTFFNFVYNSVGNRILNAANDTIRILNNLELANGRVNLGILSVAGDVRVRNAYDADNSQADLQFIGPNPQNFDLTGATNLMDGDIIFDKSVAEEVTLNSVLDIDRGGQSITFNKGFLVTTQTNVLFIDGAHSMIGPNDSSFVKGPVTKRGNQTFSFPLGDTVYAPLTISNITSGSAQFRAEYIRTVPTNDGFDVSQLEAGINNVSIIEYWQLDRLVTGAFCRVNLSWRNTSAVVVPAELTVARWNSSTMQWEDEGNTGITGTAANGTVSSNVINTFSPFTLASTSINNPLPVTYKYFEGIELPNANLLEWATLSEINADFFEVQRSEDGKEWNSIGRVKANGNSTQEIAYEFTDLDISDPILYYRLIQYDFDGTPHPTQVVVIDRKTGGEMEVNIFPNPVADGTITLSIKDQNISSPRLSIISMQGQVIMQKQLQNAFSQRIDIDVSSLSKGTYFVRIEGEGALITKKLIVL